MHLFNYSVKLLTALLIGSCDRLSLITCNASLRSVIFFFGGFWVELVKGLQHRAPDMVVHGSSASGGNWWLIVSDEFRQMTWSHSCHNKALIKFHWCYYRATLCVSAVLAVAWWPSVCLSVTLVYWFQTVQDIVKLFSRPGSPMTLVFLTRSADTHFPGNPFSGAWRRKVNGGVEILRFSTKIAVYLRHGMR